MFKEMLPALRRHQHSVGALIQDGKCTVSAGHQQLQVQLAAISVRTTTASAAELSAARQRALTQALATTEPESDPLQPVFTEKQFSDALQRQLGGVREHPAGSGFVDLLTLTHIVEVKPVHQFKQAVGQLMYYAHALQPAQYTLRLALFEYSGKLPVISVDIQQFCASVGVEVMGISMCE